MDDHAADSFMYDADGIGLGLAREVERSLAIGTINYDGYRGGERCVDPDAMYDGHERIETSFTTASPRATGIFVCGFCARIRPSNGEYMDPDELIFLDPKDPMIPQLRSELCRLPLKPNAHGKVQIMPKTEMAKAPFNLPSPNLADALMMSFSVRDYLTNSWSHQLNIGRLRTSI